MERTAILENPTLISTYRPATQFPYIQDALDTVQKGCRVRLMTPQLIMTRINQCEERLKGLKKNHWHNTEIRISADDGDNGDYGAYQTTTHANTHVTLKYHYKQHKSASGWEITRIDRNTNYYRSNTDITLANKDLIGYLLILENLLEKLDIKQPWLESTIRMMMEGKGELLYEYTTSGNIKAHIEPINRDYTLSYDPIKPKSNKEI